MTSDSTKQLFATVRRGASVSLVTKLAAKAAAFLMTLVLARNLSVDDYGAFAFVAAWLLFLVIIGVAGLDTASMRFVAQFGEEEGAEDKAATFVQWARRRVLLTATVVAAITYLATYAAAGHLAHLGNALIVTGLIALPLLVLTQFQQFALRAKRLVGQADFVGQIIRPSTVVVLVAAASLLSVQLTSAQAMAALVAGAGLSAVFGELWLRRAVPGSAGRPTREQKRQWGRTALPMVWISGSHFLLHQLDILMLGSLAGTENVAPYAVASRLADVVAFSLVVAAGIVAPLISSLYHSRRLQELREMLKVAGRWVSLAAILVAAVFVTAREPLLGLFGPAYVSAQIVLTILIVGQLTNAFAGPVGYLLSMTGNQRASAIILGAGVAVNAALNLWLIPIYQELGAALATAITTVFWNMAMTIAAQRLINLRATPI